jgi:hypothetical protein
MDSITNPKVKTMEGKRVRVCSLTRNILGVEECVGVLRWGLGRFKSKSITHIDLHKQNNKLVSASLEHFWCMDEPRANTDSQDSPWPGFGGSHHVPLYSKLSLN